MRRFNRRFSPALLFLLGLYFITLEILKFSEFSWVLDEWHIFNLRLPTFLSIAALFLLAFISYYEYHGIGPQSGIIRRGSNHPKIALTFDDGPHPEYTPKILDILKEKQVTASFFMVGRHIEKYPEIARRVYMEGHEVGNHTYSHRDLVPTTRKTLLKELNQTDEVIRRVLGIKTVLFRPPRGIFSNTVRKIIVDELGYRIVLWTVSAADWSGLSPARMLRRVRYYAHNGGIILFHDSGGLIKSEGARRDNTVKALPLIIDELQAKGFEIVPISELLEQLPQKSFMEELPETVSVEQR